MREALGVSAEGSFQGRHDLASSLVLLFSETRAPAVSVYPDSNKLGLWAGDDVDSELFFLRDTAVTWAHGEEGWNEA